MRTQSKNFLSQTLLAKYEHLLNSAKQWWDFSQPIIDSCYAFDWFEEMAATDLPGALNKLQEQLLQPANLALCEKVKLQDAEKGNYSNDSKTAGDILISLILDDKSALEDFIRVFEGAETGHRDSSAINVIPYMLDCLEHQAVMLHRNVMLNKATELELESTTLTELANVAFRRGRAAEGELLTKCSTRLDMLSGKQPFDDVNANEEVALAKKSPNSGKAKGEGQEILIPALTMHHRYADGSCLNLEPIGNNELSRIADVSTATATRFFKKWFDGHSKYCSMCRRNTSKLVDTIKAMRKEFVPSKEPNYGSVPKYEHERD